MTSSSPEGFYEALTQLVYEQNHVDELLIGGDYNGRIGDMDDYIPDIDEISPRQPLDHVHNPHGECLINFLKDTGYAVINGRITSEFDNFTSISSKGTAIVDYVCCRHENMSNVIECKVVSMNDVICEVNSSIPAFQPETISDHSIILVTLKTGEELLADGSNAAPDEENEEEECGKTWEQVGQPKPVRFKINGVKDDFLRSPEKIEELTGLIDELLEMKLTQERLDEWYGQFVKVYHEEMNSFYKKLENTPRSCKNYFIAHKPWWSDDLSESARIVHKTEHLYIKLQKENKNANNAKKEFLTAQKAFDKLVKCSKRRWQRNQVFELEKANMDDPKAFWEHIKLMRHSKKSTIPAEVYEEDGVSVTTDPGKIVDRWARDFRSLLTPPPKSMEEKAFVEEIRV